MANLTIRNVDERTHRALRLRAAENGHSVEEEIRRILGAAVSSTAAPRLPRTEKDLRAALKKAQEIFAPMRARYSVDEFLAEKRAEAAREFSEGKKKFRR